MCNKFRIKVFKVLHVLILESFMYYRFEQCNKDFFHVLVKKNVYEVKIHSLEIWQEHQDRTVKAMKS